MQQLFIEHVLEMKLKSTLYTLLEKIRNLTFKQRITALAILIGVFIAIALIPSQESETNTTDDTREVSLVNVGQTSRSTTPLEVVGTVRSQSEASLRSEAQGEVVGVYYQAGSFVTAGSVIAEISNASERAAVAQAQASVDAAIANLNKATGGVRSEERDILALNVEKAENTVENAESAARNTLSSSYAIVDDIILNKTDQIFSNPRSSNPIYNPATSESIVKNRVVQKRVTLQAIVERQREVDSSIFGEDIDLGSELDTTEEELRLIQNYLNDILITLNGAIPTASIPQTTITAYKTEVSTSRTQINTALSSILSVRDGIANAKTALAVTEKNLEQGVVGAQAEDVAALEAAVRQAQAGLASARANLSRKLIISPISGTINSLGVRRGDFINAFDLVAVVSNNNALEIETFITEEDRNDIRIGSEALVANTYKGVVTNVAPGIDPVTKKVQVRVGIEESVTNLTHQSTVRVAIERNGFDVDDNEIERISIPISALKVETNRYIVFTVNEEKTLVVSEVTPGLVLGDTIVIEDGLTSDMNIVRDARGLREGQNVIVL